jgi:hypothetical protein
MATIMDTLFGVSAERFQQERDAAADAQALQFARLSPIEKASLGVQRGAYGLAGVLGGALGGQDPELQRRTQAQQILGMIDPSKPETFDMAAQLAADRGDQQLAFGLRLEGDKYKQQALVRTDEAKIRADRLLAENQALEARRIAQSAFIPSEATLYGEKTQFPIRDDEGNLMPGAGVTQPSFDIQRVAPQLLSTAAGQAELERLQKAQTSVDEISANQLAAQLFNPDGTRNKAVETRLRASLAGQKILKSVVPETKVFKKGDSLATQNPVTGAWDVATVTGVVTTAPGANPISAMLQAGSISPTVRAYATELETQWPNLDADERRNELSKLATKNQTATTIAQKAAETKVGGSEKVQSSKVTPDGTTIIVMKDGSTRVVSATGENLTGQAWADAIIASEQFGAETQGTRAQARVGGELTSKQIGSAFTEIGKIKKNIGNIDDAIKAIDDGASTGVIASKFPNITTASITLNNVRSQLGLDVIGSVTFGALSEGELNLALDTALPTTLRPQALKQYLTEKKAAQEKLVGYLSKQISYLSKPGNNLAGWLEQTGNQGQSSLPPGVTVKKKESK